MVATILEDGAESVAVVAQDSIIYPPEARPVPILGEVHGPLPLDGEATAPEQLLPVRVMGEVVEQFQRPMGNVTYIG